MSILFKIIIIGEPAVGKSAILNRFTKQEFSEAYKVTIGVEFATKFLEIDAATKIKLQIWDTAGQEAFRAVIRTFYRNAASVFLVYSIANRKSFEALDIWLRETRENCPEDCIYVLVGNQLDQEESREVSYEEGRKYMLDNNFNLFFETSAKDGANVDQAFMETGKQIFMTYMKNEADPVRRESLNKRRQTKQQPIARSSSVSTLASSLRPTTPDDTSSGRKGGPCC